MQETTTTPTAQWVLVRDAQGLQHLEMRWSLPGARTSPALAAAA